MSELIRSVKEIELERRNKAWNKKGWDLYSARQKFPADSPQVQRVEEAKKKAERKLMDILRDWQ